MLCCTIINGYVDQNHGTPCSKHQITWDLWTFIHLSDGGYFIAAIAVMAQNHLGGIANLILIGDFGMKVMDS